MSRCSSSERGGLSPAFFSSWPVARGLVPRDRLGYRRAGACPPPCLGRNGKRRWLACVFRAGRALAGDRPPRDGMQGRLRFTVGRGPVPRHASVEETALVGVRFLRGSNDRGGQAPALRNNLANRGNRDNPAPNRGNPVNPAPLLLIS